MTIPSPQHLETYVKKYPMRKIVLLLANFAEVWASLKINSSDLLVQSLQPERAA